MGIRDRVKSLGSKAISRGIDVVAKRLYGDAEKHWSEEERASGIILSGSSRTASQEATELAQKAGYEIKDRPEPSLGINRPKAGRTFGARFDHYPILSPTGALPPKGSEAVWDITDLIRPPLSSGLAEFKEKVIVAFTAIGSPESELLEDQLLELHPVVEPQCTVLFVRVGNLEEDRLYWRVKLGNVALTLPHVPVVMVFHLDKDGTLTYKSLAQGRLDATAPRFGILSLLEGQTWLPEGAVGTMEMVSGKTRHRSTAADHYKRTFSTKIDLEETAAGE